MSAFEADRFNHSRTSPHWDNQVVCRNLVDGAFGPSLRSGFRLRAPAALTPATRLNFNHSRTSPRWDTQVVCRNLVDGAFGPSLRSRPQPGPISTAHAPLRAVRSKPSFRTIRSLEANDLHSRRACFHLLLRKKSCKISEHPLASTPFRSSI